ncbi:uncharacterized protein B0H18DRAFT_969459 [Fomitopsis serialis]|uniref:uncharacterized protein n=1 Tax=Fomitopsis serialis TaxID=139415 RepID=UPI0020085EE7|nr:uncharacterized protein B0H18DRAFT_969459 [Neoantrodia serialis]KAH9937178.1 hypothetical protein B0H18DRAFT_969459 [Neoantrodia serialis]
MLARHTSHRTASFVSLHFLAPRLLCRQNSTSSGPSGSSRARGNRGSTRPVASSSASALDPAKLIGQLDKQLQKFHALPLDGLTPNEVQVFNEAIMALRQAVKTADTRTACHIWRMLKDRHMLRFFGPVHYNLFSRFVEVVCTKRKEFAAWSEQEKKALPEFAVFAAVGGATEGLKQCMLVHIRENNPQAVIELFEQYWASLETKAPLSETGQADSQDPMQADGEQADASATNTSLNPAANLVRGDVLLAAFTAFAMQNSLVGALQMALRTTVRVPPSVIAPWLQCLPDSQLGERVEQFVRRLDVAKLLAHPSALTRHLSNLTRDQAAGTLQNFYRRVMDGLTGPSRWLAVSQTQKDADKLVVVPGFTWQSFITAFMHCRRTDLAQNVWNDVIKLGIRPTVTMWTALIEGYAELKAPDDALGTWDVMLSQGIKPDALAYRALIYALYHSKRIDEAVNRFEEFQGVRAKMSPQPEEATVLVVYNAMLHGLLFYNREEQARALLGKMQSEGPKPDIVTHNTFLRWYARKDQLKSFAETLQMLEPSGLKGDVYTYSIVLSALMKVRDDAPQIMLNLMQRHGVRPNTATMTSIIDQQMGTRTEVGLRSALDLLGRMERGDIEGAEPNEVTYTAILTAIHRSDWLDRKVVDEYRQTIWDRMETRGIRPKRTTYNILIKACFDNPDPEGVQQAMQYYRDMTRNGAFMANDTWWILLHGLQRRKEWAVANELVEDMRRRQFVPSGALAELIQVVRKRTGEKRRAGPASYF